jgi:Uncharacterised nucleotidyltransferase
VTEVDPSAYRVDPAFRVLCAVARSAMDRGAEERLRGAVSDLTAWESVPALLAQHGLTIIGVRHLSTIRDRISPDVWAILERQAREATALALQGASELCRIIDAFETRGIAVLAFKGPVLAWRAYRDFGARTFLDLDLLVSPGDVDAGFDALGALGYAPVYRFRDRQEAWFRLVDGDYQLVDGRTGGLVELHARAMSRRFAGMPPTEDLWARRDAVPLGGRLIPALSGDDAFLLQALHGAKHRWERLEWVAALAELLRQRGGDVAPLLQKVPEARRAVLLACAVAATWLDAPLSSETRAQCDADSVVGRLVADAWQHIVRGDEGDADETVAKLAFNWRVQRGTASRIRFAYRWILWPSPEDWAFVRLPDVLFFAYRFVRPMRLLSRYGRRRAVSRPSHA